MLDPADWRQAATLEHEMVDFAVDHLAGLRGHPVWQPMPHEEAVAELCRGEGLWMQVDGCVGALVALAPAHRHLVRGMERADSLAFDPHKWLQAPFDVGCATRRYTGAPSWAMRMT